MTPILARSVLRLLLVVMLTDLVFLQHGRIPSIHGFPLRFYVFGAGMASFALIFLFLPRRERCQFFSPASGWLPLTVALLALVVPLWGAWRGWQTGAPVSDLINDSNGHVFYLAALPMACSLGGGDRGWLLRVLQRVVLVFCVLCLFVYVSAILHSSVSNFIEFNLRTRDWGFLNEFTDGRPYRLFLKSYIFVVLVFFLVFFRLVAGRATRMDIISLLLTGAVLWNSYTRSVLLVLAAGMAVITVLQFRGRALRYLLPPAAVILLVTSVLFCSGKAADLRLDDRDGTAAGRLVQAGELWASFTSQPLLGQGFGSRVGANTGFSVELDLLNLLRKIGIVGLICYCLAFAVPAISAWRQWYLSPGCPEPVAFFAAACITVFGLGAANPYATASLGVGAMAIALATLSASGCARHS